VNAETTSKTGFSKKLLWIYHLNWGILRLRTRLRRVRKRRAILLGEERRIR
jgi:hypothetical protein